MSVDKRYGGDVPADLSAGEIACAAGVWAAAYGTAFAMHMLELRDVPTVGGAEGRARVAHLLSVDVAESAVPRALSYCFATDEPAPESKR